MKRIAIFLMLLVSSVPLFAQSLIQDWRLEHNENNQQFERAISANDGFVYVIRDGTSLIKIDQSGDNVWAKRLNFYSRALTTDDQGNVFLAGAIYFPVVDPADYGKSIAIVAKISSDGSDAWIRTFGDSLTVSANYKIIYHDGLVISSGRSNHDNGTTFACLTMAFGVNGQLVWRDTYDGWRGSFFPDFSSAVSDSMYFVTAGVARGSELLVYSLSGERLWAKINPNFYPTSIAADERGNVYLAGKTESYGNAAESTLLVFDAIGQSKWGVRKRKTHSTDYSAAVGIVVIGEKLFFLDYSIITHGPIGTHLPFLKAYSTAGDSLWTRPLAGSRPEAMAILGGHLYMTGLDMHLIQTDFNGKVTFEDRREFGYGITVNQNGGVYVVSPYSLTKFVVDTPTSVNDEREEAMPGEFFLGQNYPNPFNPSTTIHFSLPGDAFVTLKIYNAIGQEVRTLVDQEFPSGVHAVNWDANDFSAGVYFYQLRAGEFMQTRRLVLLK